MKKFKTPSAVIVFLLKNSNGRRQILLQRRKNTGFGDGMWDLSCSGHVEYKESMLKAAVRECKEELGIQLNAANLHFAAFIHKRDEVYDKTYCNAYFYSENFLGEPQVCEPNKCSEIKWFYIDELPLDLLDDRRTAINAFLRGEPYVEYGWNK